MDKFFAVHDLFWAGELIAFVALLSLVLYASLRVFEGIRFKWSGNTASTQSSALGYSGGGFILMLFAAMPAGEFLQAADASMKLLWMAGSALTMWVVIHLYLAVEIYLLFYNKRWSQ